MRRSAFRLLVAVSFTLLAHGRPRYGDTLRVEMQAAVRSLDPAEWPADRSQAIAKARLISLVFEPLVRLDSAGRPQPALAMSWRKDAAGKRWQFRLRSGVTFHDGSALTPASASGALRIEGATISTTADALVVQFEQAQPDLLNDLAHPRNSLVLRSAEGVLSGTGPFQVKEWEAGRRGVFGAYEQYWGGRPFLDAVRIELGKPLREQMLSLEVGSTDLIEISPADVRRAGQRGLRTWSSSPVELLAIEFARKPDSRIVEGLSAAIDRAAIHNVLLQKQGEPTGAYLPQWLSGYAFLFHASRDLGRARQLLAGTPAMSLGYDATDALARSIADRVALNARDAGLILRAVPLTDSAEVRLARLPVSLSDLPATAGSNPERLYAAERELIDRLQLVPLVHVPVSFGLGARVRGWSATPTNVWRLEDVWMEPRP